MLSYSSKLELIISAIIVVIFGLFFYKKQNLTCAMGGKISKAKNSWLCLAIYIYFPLTTLLAIESTTEGFKRIFICISFLMWFRAIAELYLLYGIKKWSTLMGIGHNAVCLMIILFGISYFKYPWQGFQNFYLALGLISLCLILDSCYAYQFRKIVHGKTKGKEGVWFADEEQERFRKLNNLTHRWNWIVLSILIVLLWRIF